MNIRELRKAIADLPDAMLVVMQRDADGNGYSPLACIDGDNNAYRADDGGEVGPMVLREEDVAQGYGHRDVGGVACCVLCPEG